MDRPIKVAELDTPLEQFAYWLERDWPRVKELKWLALERQTDPNANPLYERMWYGIVTLGEPDRDRVRQGKVGKVGGFPVLQIVAESMTPGRTVVAWHEWVPSNYEGVVPPVQALADWVRYRFGEVEVKDEGEDESATVAYALVPLVIETEDGLKAAILAVEPEPSTAEWWAEVAKLFYAHKRAKAKYTLVKLAELLGMDEKHVGKMVRKYRPKTPQNTPKQRPKGG